MNGDRRTRSVRVAWVRLAAPAVVFAVLVWRLGTSPFLAGLRTVNGGALAAAAGLVLFTTVCCAWRWTVVARGLGVDLSLSAAVAAYYRALFLNVTLPGGVMGDVHRGISHGREVSDIGRGMRSVVWERFAGQAVQILLTVVVLLGLPSPVRPYMPWAAIAGMVGICGIWLLAQARPGGALSRWGRIRRAAVSDVRDGLFGRRASPCIAIASALSVAGHAAIFLLAARTAGIAAPPSRLLPIALLVMAAMVLPSFGGWGPRDGVTAWAFGAAGLGASRGVATAVVYGVMVFVACLPGAPVLFVAWVRRDRSPERPRPPLREQAAHA